ncbi:hypothetical protein P5G50_07915 [Leifsonia sp. F6_8S_P_1B]|uniref:Uncharacterized protein n=1 Tax=Leifsonia williamsii TaxID=3035919 RepID=A0ABT8KA96_9MICO|nr:hypothetical protein [Leifsonia williamsii]MDN4614373.1 hypothetical protein [Leifsonia williamsii]
MTQDEPIMDGSTEATHEDRLAGVVQQVRADLQLRPEEDREELLRQRLTDVGIELDDAEFARIVGEL